jgi:hypothetical protein
MEHFPLLLRCTMIKKKVARGKVEHVGGQWKEYLIWIFSSGTVAQNTNMVQIKPLFVGPKCVQRASQNLWH